MRVVVCVAAMLMAIGSWRAAAQRATDPAAETEPVVEKDALFADLDSMTEGTQVWLHDVVVREKSGNVLRIGDRHHHQLFVVPPDPSLLDFLAIGAHVDVRGTLRITPGAAQARLTYAMSRSAAWRLAHDRLYVDAWSVVSS